MKSNARCWKRRAAALLIVMLLLNACAMGGSEVKAPCPPVVEYSAADQERAATEIEALPEGAVVIKMLSDYSVLRDQSLACR